MLAPSHMPLWAQYSQCLNIGTVPALAITALAATLREAQITCCKFKVQHWATLFSLRSLRKAVLTLQHSEQAPGQQPLLITSQRMQLTNLQFLQFDSTRVEFAAPLLAHAAALTSLKTLFFVDCSLGMLPAGVLHLPQLSTLGMHGCQLSQLPSLAPLTRLVRLQLPGNPALVDLRPALAAMQQLWWLQLGGTTPLTAASLDALRGLSQLKCIDVSNHAWSATNAAALGYLVQLTHERGCKLIM
jgi:Leucine-rich repeat (LRR) protein